MFRFMIFIGFMTMFLPFTTFTAEFDEAFYGNGRPPRKIFIDEKKMMIIDPKNANVAEIVIASDAGAATRFAAEELQRFLEKRLQSKIPLVNTPNANKISFIMGINAWVKAAGIDYGSLCRDAFVIKTRKNKIYILGRDAANVNPRTAIEKGGGWAQMYEQGTLFGVYDFLERFAGVRFFFPGEIGTIVPRGKTLLIPEIDIYDRPDYECRSVSIWSGVGIGEKQRKAPFQSSISPAKAQAYHYYRLQTRYVPCCHGLNQLGLLQRFGKSHPEYFALKADGKHLLNPTLQFQPCLSSGLMKEVYKDAAAYLTGNPASSRGIKTFSGKTAWNPVAFQPGFFSLVPSDGFYKCHCPQCQKHFKEGPKSVTNFIWHQMIWVAKSLKENKIPGKVTMMAYSPYHLVPEESIPDNMLVMLACKGPWAEPARQEQDNKLIKRWVEKLGRKTWLWTYCNKFGGLKILGIPSVTPRAIGKFYKQQSPYIYGSFMESEVDNWLYNYLNFYVFSKVAWDNKTDVNALLREHHELMFGPAAQIMQRIFNRMEDLWVKRIAGRTINTSLGPVTVPPSDYDLWNKIYSPTEIADLVNAFKEAEKMAKKDTDALKRVKFIQHEFLDPLIGAYEKYYDRNDAIMDFKIGISPLPDSEKIIVDGKLVESAWKNATTIYLQPLAPFPKETSHVKTTLKITIDDQNLYVAYDCAEPEMDKISTTGLKNDDPDIWKGDGVEIFLNPSGDRQHYYQILFNSAEIMADQACKTLGTKFKGDFKWNSGAVLKTTWQSNSWQAEIAIPLKNLKNFIPSHFSANFCRNRVTKKTVHYTWSPFLKHGYHEPGNFGNILVGRLPNKSIVADGSFEVSPNRKNIFGKWHYNTRRGNFASLDESTFISGGKSLKLTVSPQADVADRNLLYGVTQYLPKLKPGKRYRISYFIKLDDVKPLCSGGGVTVNIVDDKNRWFSGNKLTGTTSWLKQTFEFIAGSQTNILPHRSYIRLYMINASGSAWFDDIKLTEMEK